MRFHLVSLCIILLLFQACTSATQKNALILGVEADIKNLDPRFATDAYSQRALELIYSGLVRMDKKGNIVPDLATGWSMLDDKTYVFKIREGVTFHDGKGLSPSDIVYTLNSFKDEKTASPFKAAFSKIQKVEVSNPSEIKITLDKPDASFLTDLVIARIIPQHVDVETKPLNEFPVGCGPYQFIESSIGLVKLKKFEGYFGGKASMQELHIKTVADDTTRITLLQKKQVDIIYNILPPEAVKDFEKDSNFDVRKTPSFSVKYLIFNLKDPILKKQKVRQALAYALNREQIIKHVLEGMAVKADGVLSPNNPFYSDDVKKYNYDIFAAKKLLDEAGYPKLSGKEHRLSLEYKTSTNPEAMRVATILANQLRAIDINVKLSTYEWGTFYADIKSGNFQLASLIWVGVTDPNLYHVIFHSSMIPPQGSNRGYFSNAVMDQLTTLGQVTLDPLRRKSIYAQVQKIASEELPYIPLWHPLYFSVSHKGLKNVDVWPNGSYWPLLQVTK